eukprot:4016043-Amphidinium_carterae.1
MAANDRQAGDANPDGGSRRCREDDDSLQAQAWCTKKSTNTPQTRPNLKGSSRLPLSEPLT